MIGILTNSGTGIARLGIYNFGFEQIPQGSTIESIRVANFVVSNQGFLTEPNTLTVGYYANATVSPASALASGTVNLFNGPPRHDYASSFPGLSSISLATAQSSSFGVIIELAERGAAFIYSFDLVVSFKGNSASIRDKYMLDAIPDIPEELHEVLPQLMAINASQPVANTDQAWARIAAMRGDLNELIDRWKLQNGAVNSPIGSLAYRRRFINLRSGSIDG